MSEYKDPFWTEQTTKTTTTTTTEPKNMKTNSDYTFFIFMAGIIVIFISLTADNYYKMQQELEFVKAGLVQKVEDGKVIWTKP